MNVGDIVRLTGSHPFAGRTGEVVSKEVVMGKIRPRIRLHDMQDHEVFIMRDDHAEVLREQTKRDCPDTSKPKNSEES